jgi:hypothetical protein
LAQDFKIGAPPPLLSLDQHRPKLVPRGRD